MFFSRSLISILFVTLQLWALPAQAQLEPWAELPWSDDGLVLRDGGKDSLAVGPTALGVGPDFVVVANPAHANLGRIDMDGRLTMEPAPFAAADLAVDSRGAIGLLGEKLERVAWLEPGKPWQVRPLAQQGAGPRRLAWDDKGGLWLELSDGTAHCVSQCEAFHGKRVLPVSGGKAQAWAKVVNEHETVVWSWPIEVEADFKQPKAVRTQVHTEERAGLVRVLGNAPLGGLFVMLEFAQGTEHLKVDGEVRLLDARGRSTGTVRLPLTNAAPVNRWATVGPRGAVWIMRSEPEQLVIYRVDKRALETNPEVKQ